MAQNPPYLNQETKSIKQVACKRRQTRQIYAVSISRVDVWRPQVNLSALLLFVPFQLIFDIAVC